MEEKKKNIKLPPWVEKRIVSSRSVKRCELCGAEITSDKYLRFTNPKNGFEYPACLCHLDEEAEEAYYTRRCNFWEESQRERIELICDGNCWGYAFLVYDVKGGKRKLLHKENGPETRAVILAEAMAIKKAVEWVTANLKAVKPMVIHCDNFAVIRKIDTGSTRGKFREFWAQFQEAINPFRAAGCIFIGDKTHEAHMLCQRDAIFGKKKPLRPMK